MSKRLDNFIIASKQNRGDSFYLLELLPRESITEMPEVEPGQFVEISVTDSGTAFLRRPISICDFEHSTGKLTLLVKAVGKGTDWIISQPEGAVLNLIWPLGQGFTLPEKSGSSCLLCGGGVGVAPLLYLGKKLKEKGCSPIFVLGARNASQLMLIDHFALYGEIRIMTDDGSAGQKGLVTDCDAFTTAAPSMIYTCGPTPMMKAVARKAMQYGIACEASLENMMACGMGACLGCVENTKEGNLCVCSNGPVFNINLLKWNQ